MCQQTTSKICYEGIEIGMQRGKKHWMQQGIEQGMERGKKHWIQQGVQQGIHRGKKQGIEQERNKIISILDYDNIGLTEEQKKIIIAEFSRSAD